MRIIGLLTVAALFGLFAVGPVAAQDRGLAQRTALAERVIRLSAGPNFTKVMEAMIADQLAKADTEGQGAEEAAWLRSNAPRMLTAMVDDMMADMVPHYASMFTVEELEAQIAFYDSPVGRQVATKTLQLSAVMNEITMEHLTVFIEELMTKYCAQFDCETGGQTGRKSGRR
ncbi:MAG: DUF2059 domain-containing protein [Alphaproteobacteria bacterium]|uniref:DUF2059 domain-containing protein n=1 Tax=Brevundimonas sp. TaxID=1871086 RepID=UPI001DF81C42|nr:DUF2059 domain-containing protein [Alphaproteobacteria bacterium]MBU1522426.1 DUF2059 domain-containing protein [Alphaproteobacteria bacterium]MBU2030443.1 DUF2059 domain-containing protein [Alphaproteobacteria bacterium]MBU2164857.1 DUF2059 domain-containing protein [Alphaproteobacteria bacterium]MBU2231662.1 DUF2059 domain-containing protein [Alphaproteobacteria bacterium]